MRRLFMIFLLVLMPLQLSWAAMASYCTKLGPQPNTSVTMTISTRLLMVKTQHPIQPKPVVVTLIAHPATLEALQS
jgi:hypothetical protein